MNKRENCWMLTVGLEEISARLNLMVKAELAELVAGAPMNPGDPETRCQHLEKLLGKKIFYDINRNILLYKICFLKRSIRLEN